MTDWRDWGGRVNWSR